MVLQVAILVHHFGPVDRTLTLGDLALRLILVFANVLLDHVQTLHHDALGLGEHLYHLAALPAFLAG